MDNSLILSSDGKILIGVKDKSIKSVVIHQNVTKIGLCAFDDWSEEQRTEMIISITETKEEMMKEYHPPKSTERKHE